MLLMTRKFFLLSQISIIREQLLSDFIPDDVCPLGAQFMDPPRTVYHLDPNENNSTEEVTAKHHLQT